MTTHGYRRRYQIIPIEDIDGDSICIKETEESVRKFAYEYPPNVNSIVLKNYIPCSISPFLVTLPEIKRCKVREVYGRHVLRCELDEHEDTDLIWCLNNLYKIFSVGGNVSVHPLYKEEDKMYVLNLNMKGCSIDGKYIENEYFTCKCAIEFECMFITEQLSYVIMNVKYIKITS